MIFWRIRYCYLRSIILFVTITVCVRLAEPLTYESIWCIVVERYLIGFDSLWLGCVWARILMLEYARVYAFGWKYAEFHAIERLVGHTVTIIQTCSFLVHCRCSWFFYVLRWLRNCLCAPTESALMFSWAASYDYVFLWLIVYIHGCVLLSRMYIFTHLHSCGVCVYIHICI